MSENYLIFEQVELEHFAQIVVRLKIKKLKIKLKIHV